MEWDGFVPMTFAIG
jgi:hypothetical protein